jgi:hypothetical protein
MALTRKSQMPTKDAMSEIALAKLRVYSRSQVTNMSETISNVPAQAPDMIVQNGVPTIVSSGHSDLQPGVNVMSGNEQLHTISVSGREHAGRAGAVSHVFARRGFNIESLASRAPKTRPSRA